jgi:hypothetical protein
LSEVEELKLPLVVVIEKLPCPVCVSSMVMSQPEELTAKVNAVEEPVLLEHELGLRTASEVLGEDQTT